MPSCHPSDIQASHQVAPLCIALAQLDTVIVESLTTFKTNSIFFLKLVSWPMMPGYGRDTMDIVETYILHQKKKNEVSDMVQ